MNRIVLSTAFALAAVAPFTLHGGDVPDTANRLSLGARFGFNFKADFRNAPADPGPATGGADHTYDDGYVLLDSSGNAGGLTSNWGYDNASQVVGDTMQFHAVQQEARDSTTGDPQLGAELVYQRACGNFSSSGRWGFEAGFGFTDIDLRSKSGGDAFVTTDTYQLNGVLPPGPGYNGTFNGPGALLGDTPTRTIDSASVTSNQKLHGQMFTIRVGPFAEWYLTPKFSLAASVGITLAPTTAHYDFSDTVVPTAGGSYSASDSSSKTELLYGPYVGATLRYEFNKNWGVYVGAQFQSLTDLKQSVGGHTAKLDPGATIYATIGVSLNF